MEKKSMASTTEHGNLAARGVPRIACYRRYPISRFCGNLLQNRHWGRNILLLYSALSYVKKAPKCQTMIGILEPS